jgi:hypothetical protein
MQDAFAIVLFVVVGVAAVAAVLSLFVSRSSYDQIGRGGMSIGEDRPLRPTGSGAPSAAASAEREADIRDMLEARNARRVARGEDARDVDAELAELLRPAVASDPALEEEIRSFVESSNARRVARGLEPLDVDAEVARRLRDV